jgi:hypothetical protein
LRKGGLSGEAADIRRNSQHVATTPSIEDRISRITTSSSGKKRRIQPKAGLLLVLHLFDGSRISVLSSFRDVLEMSADIRRGGGQL